MVSGLVVGTKRVVTSRGLVRVPRHHGGACARAESRPLWVGRGERWGRNQQHWPPNDTACMLSTHL